jgi:hypothetical protein
MTMCMGRDLTSQIRHRQWAYCSSPRWYVGVDSHGDNDALKSYIMGLRLYFPYIFLSGDIYCVQYILITM